MSGFGAIVDLAEAKSWDPGQLVGSTLVWPGGVQTSQLRAVAHPLLPTGWARDGLAVITPSGLDPVTGAIQRRSFQASGPVFEVRADGGGVRPADLLMPQSPESPVTRVQPHHMGSLAAGSFLALRSEQSLWLWAVLNSRTGQRFRALARSEHVPTRSALLEMPVPMLPARSESLLNALTDLESCVGAAPEQAAVETWWRVTNLTDGSWSLPLSVPDPDLLAAGTPLGELVTRVRPGRQVPGPNDEPVPGWLPVADHRFLRTGRPRRWVDPAARSVTAEPGDVLISGIGERPYAWPVAEKVVVGSDVYALSPKVSQDAGLLVNYLNSQAGYGMRQTLLTGLTIRRLSREHLLAMPVVEQEKARNTGAFTLPLADELESLLWS